MTTTSSQTTFRLPRWVLPKFACWTCRDHRRVPAPDGTPASCPSCGALDEFGYSSFRKKRYWEMHPRPEITESNLSKAEKVELDRLCLEYRVSPITALSWLEGRRYQPENDPEFLEECNAVMAHLQAIVDSKPSCRMSGRTGTLAALKGRSLAEMRADDTPTITEAPPDPSDAFNLATSELFEDGW